MKTRVLTCDRARTTHLWRFGPKSICELLELFGPFWVTDLWCCFSIWILWVPVFLTKWKWNHCKRTLRRVSMGILGPSGFVRALRSHPEIITRLPVLGANRTKWACFCGSFECKHCQNGGRIGYVFKKSHGRESRPVHFEARFSLIF
jgi:hypothetical protein